MKVKIISDGTVFGTRVVNAETGEKIEMIRKVSWGHDTGGLPTATLEIICVPVEVEGEAVAEVTEITDTVRKFERLSAPDAP